MNLQEGELLEEATPRPQQQHQQQYNNSSSSIDNNNNNNNQKPRKFFALHIGPSKTGTSTIQKSLSGLPFEADNPMGETRDNLIYVGKRTLAEWKDPNIDETIRTVGGKGYTPREETKAYHRHIRPCMLAILDEYFDDDGGGDGETVETPEDRLEHDESTRAALRTRLTGCWRSDEENHDFRYMLDGSILDSNEAYSYGSRSGSGGDNGAWVGPGRIFWAFDVLGYGSLRLVAAYRRYADWLVSTHTQKVKTTCLRAIGEGHLRSVPCLRIDEWIRQAMKKRGDNRFNARTYVNVHQSLPAIAAAGPSRLGVRVLNYFQLPHDNDGDGYDSITTELYCDALGPDLTPNLCGHARARQRDGAGSGTAARTLGAAAAATAAVVNKGSTSDAIYQSIVAAGYRLGYLLPTSEETAEAADRERRCSNASSDKKKNRKKPKGPLVWCPLLEECLDQRHAGRCGEEGLLRAGERDAVTAGGTVSIAGVSGHAVATYRDLSRHHTGVHGAVWTQTLPVRCPPIGDLRALLGRSLELEDLVLPGFAAGPLGRAEHERVFRDVWLARKRLFCWVDTDRLFANATTWDEIIDERMVGWDWGEASHEPSEPRTLTTQKISWTDV